MEFIEKGWNFNVNGMEFIENGWNAVEKGWNVVETGWEIERLLRKMAADEWKAGKKG